MKVPPHFPHPTSLRHERSVKRAMKDFPNGIGYGTITILLEILVSQPNLKYPVEDIDILADEVGISIPIIRTVIEKYGIFSLTKDEEGESFFSFKLNNWMEPYYKKIEENRLKGIKSGLARNQKINKEIKELELSQNDSSEPRFNYSSTAVERKEEKRKEENIKEYKRKNLSYNQNKFKNLKSFKQFVINNYEGLVFTLERGNPCEYKIDTQLKINNGYLKNMCADKDLSSDDAMQIWQYLFTKQYIVLGKNNE